MTTLSEIVNQDVFGVSIGRLGIFFSILLVTFIIRSVFFYIVDKKTIALAKKTKTEFDDLVINAVRTPLRYLILLQGFYLAVLSLELPEKIGLVEIAGLLHGIYILAFSFILLYFIFKIIDVIAFFLYREAKKSESTLDDQLVPLLDSAMKKRRINFYPGITYGTTVSKVKEVVAGIKKIIEDDEKFDHSFYMARFTDFGAYSLNIFIYCFTKTTAWAESLAVREEFNLKIMQLLEELGVEIAFPSQTIYLNEMKWGN